MIDIDEMVCMKREDGTQTVYILNSKAPEDAIHQLILLQPNEHYTNGIKLDSSVYGRAIAKVCNDISSYMGSVNGLFEHPRFYEMYEKLREDAMKRNHLSYVIPTINWVFARWDGDLPIFDEK